MRRRVGPRLLVVLAIVAVFSWLVGRTMRSEWPPESSVPVSFSELPGFAADDLPAAFRVFRTSCAKMRGAGVPSGLRDTCAAAADVAADPAAVTAFFERRFIPRRITAPAFLTGYYEPVVAGSLTATAAFPTPLYAAPPGLVGVTPGATSGLDPILTAAQKLPDGRLVALPDRAGIETGALIEARPIAFVSDPVEAFFIQVQGSARLRLQDGTTRRLAYAGRNGYPYTSIGKILVKRLDVPPANMGMTQLKAWIRAAGQGETDAGTKLMRENRAFVFFRFDDSLAPKAGPIGGAGVALTPLRSLAIDRSLWPYGLPFYVDTTLPDATPFRRLMVAQDTGAAIRGPGRADVFFGTGDVAGQESGAMRQPGTLFVLWPKDDAGAVAP
jgi:membrane-bound lytic murein transglycosylase A